MLIICPYKNCWQSLMSVSSFIICTRNKNRTCTPLRELVPETSASTNSAIRASPLRVIDFYNYCAQDKSRTCTLERAPPPQSGVSTNFTTWATIAFRNVKAIAKVILFSNILLFLKKILLMINNYLFSGDF